MLAQFHIRVPLMIAFLVHFSYSTHSKEIFLLLLCEDLHFPGHNTGPTTASEAECKLRVLGI